MAKQYGDASMKSVFVYSDKFQGYSFSPEHPFNQLRVTLTYDLLVKSGFLSPSQVIPPRMATDEEIALIHTEDYINAVKRAGEGHLEQSIAMTYGLGTEDTPMFPHMHEASALLVGGTLTAVDAVMSGKSNVCIKLRRRTTSRIPRKSIRLLYL